jgi:hypothetical protein
MSTFSVTLKVDPAGKLNPREVYDALMSEIEPDLVTSAIPTLKAKYKKETPAQKQARAIRYKNAYAEYDKALAQFVHGIKTHAATSKKKALASTEAKEREIETQQLAEMETLFTK